MKNALWLGLLAASLGALVLLSNWIELPCVIQAPGKVFARQKWILVRGRDGQLIATLFDHVQISVAPVGWLEYLRHFFTS